MEISLKIVKHTFAITLALISFPIVCARNLIKGSRFETKKSREISVRRNPTDHAFNTEKALLKTRKLCEDFISPTEHFSYSADEVDGFERTGARRTLSIVTCSGADQSQAATFRWDAGSGSLCSFVIDSSYLESKYPKLSNSAKSMPFSKAAELGTICMAHLLWKERAKSESFVLQNLEKKSAFWNANYLYLGKKIQISINAYTGDLTVAKFSTTP